jgi:ABC-type antimicrobial peptide transport system permease subunit
MSKTGFPIVDLLRRKLQTSLIVVTLTLAVASTLFLLLFSDRLGYSTALSAGFLTQGLSAIFSQIIFFIEILVFVVGAVLTAFVTYLMMAQRTCDFGLMKAAGCPSSLVGGYFLTELLTIAFSGCILGIVLGFLADFVVANLVFSFYWLPNFLFAPLVFVVFLVLAFVFGLQPILKAAKLSSAEALSPVHYYGISVGKKHKAVSKSGLTWRIALRSLIRRQSATVRVFILLSVVFILLTVSVAGGVIARDTTVSWVQNVVNEDTVAIAHTSLGNQYELLLSKFSGVLETGVFNYSDPDLGISNEVVYQVSALPNVSLVDSRLVTEMYVKEIGNFTVDPDSLQTYPVGDSREGESIVIGVDPQKLVSEWSITGRFLSGRGDLEAVIGDSVSHTMYSFYANKYTVLADPLVEGIEFQNTTFSIVGVCVDPINNGLVTYVPLDKLENITGIANPNLLLVKLSNSANRDTAIAQIRNTVQVADSSLAVFDLRSVTVHNVNFLVSTWQTIMLLPIFTLGSATLCLVGYMMLAVDEQHQEFGVLRAVGAKPKAIVFILAIQSLIVLTSSFAVGTSLGTMIALIILMKQPLVTSFAILEITCWFLVSLTFMFILSLYPAFRLAKAPILRVLT